jgi:hypothetical protein
MKCIITILQNKRVSLPYLFGKYSFPKMRKIYPGDFSLVHIWHNAHNPDYHLESNRKLGGEKLLNVEAFINSNKFFNAEIITHNKTSPEWPGLESIKLALETTIARNADFHLWLEDDAIVYDKDCDYWATTLGSCDVGLYRDTNCKQMINTAYFLSTSEFDKRLLHIIHEYKAKPRDLYKGKGSQLEHTFWLAARKPSVFDLDKAIRHHPYSKHTKTSKDVADWLSRKLPDISTGDLHTLRLDFDE